MKRPHRLVAGVLPQRKWFLLFLLIAPVLILSLVLATALGQSRLLSSRESSYSATEQLPRYLPKLAYLISGTRGEGGRLRRLLQAVYHPRNFYVVHIAASPEEWADLWQYVTLEPVFRAHDNVHVMAADTVSDKGPTVVAFTLHAVAVLLRKSKKWDWFINLNAADYPLMPQDGNIPYPSLCSKLFLECPLNCRCRLFLKSNSTQ